MFRARWFWRYFVWECGQVQLLPREGATGAKTGAMTVIACGRMSAKPYLTNDNDIVVKTQPNVLRMNASVAVVRPERSAVSECSIFFGAGDRATELKRSGIGSFEAPKARNVRAWGNAPGQARRMI